RRRAQRAGEGHERGIGTAAGNVVRVHALAGTADDVDDDAAALRLHLREVGAREIDVAEDLEVPGLAPTRLVDLLDGATGNGAGVVDENVDVGKVTREPARRLAAAEIERYRGDGDIVMGADLAFGRLEIAGVSRHQHEVAALGREDPRGRPPDTLGAAGDERFPSGEIEIHWQPPPRLLPLLCGTLFNA